MPSDGLDIKGKLPTLLNFSMIFVDHYGKLFSVFIKTKDDILYDKNVILVIVNDLCN